MRRAASLALALIAASSGGCGGASTDVVAPPAAVADGLSRVASAHVDELVEVMRTRSVRRRDIAWETFRARAVEAAPRAQTVVQAYPIVERALALLGDGHSSYRTRSGVTLFVPTRSCRASGALAAPALLPTDVGYVRVGAFSGDSAAAERFAAGIQGAIRDADRDGLAGWIVDLRGNGGGNMWPMVAGLGPILGDDVLGHFVDADGHTTAWSYGGGASRLGGVAVQVVASPYRLRRERPRVAVLVDNGVASSGEAVLVSFRARPGARAFGTATCGLSTANTPIVLSDGAVLNLTTAVMADRALAPYGDAIAPDETIADPDDTMRRAVAWLRAGALTRAGVILPM